MVILSTHSRGLRSMSVVTFTTKLLKDTATARAFMAEMKLDFRSVYNTKTAEKEIELMKSLIAGENLLNDGSYETSSSAKAVWPVKNGVITSPFGWRVSTNSFHHGIDIATGHPNRTDPIRAAFAGKVITTSDNGGYGFMIDIDHGHGKVTRYAHTYRADLQVVEGQIVRAGQAISKVGNAGNSSGAHLHFEILLNGVAVDPMSDPEFKAIKSRK